MALVEDDDLIQALCQIEPVTRSTLAFCHGERIELALACLDDALAQLHRLWRERDPGLQAGVVAGLGEISGDLVRDSGRIHAFQGPIATAPKLACHHVYDPHGRVTSPQVRRKKERSQVTQNPKSEPAIS
jgi:hypothetical protein